MYDLHSMIKTFPCSMGKSGVVLRFLKICCVYMLDIFNKKSLILFTIYLLRHLLVMRTADEVNLLIKTGNVSTVFKRRKAKQNKTPKQILPNFCGIN